MSTTPLGSRWILWWYFLATPIMLLALGVLTVTLFLQLSRTETELRDRTTYLCLTSGSIASVLTNAANQIEVAINNGTYRRAIKAGISTPKGVEKARETMRSYRKTAATLSAPGNPCDVSR